MSIALIPRMFMCKIWGYIVSFVQCWVLSNGLEKCSHSQVNIKVTGLLNHSHGILEIMEIIFAFFVSFLFVTVHRELCSPCHIFSLTSLYLLPSCFLDFSLSLSLSILHLYFSFFSLPSSLCVSPIYFFLSPSCLSVSSRSPSFLPSSLPSLFSTSLCLATIWFSSFSQLFSSFLSSLLFLWVFSSFFLIFVLPITLSLICISSVSLCFSPSLIFLHTSRVIFFPSLCYSFFSVSLSLSFFLPPFLSHSFYFLSKIYSSQSLPVKEMGFWNWVYSRAVSKYSYTWITYVY